MGLTERVGVASGPRYLPKVNANSHIIMSNRELKLSRSRAECIS